LISASVDVHVQVTVTQDDVGEPIEIPAVVGSTDRGRRIAFPESGLVQDPSLTTLSHLLVNVPFEGLLDVAGFEIELLAIDRHVGH
jgi:hypothetical protein